MYAFAHTLGISERPTIEVVFRSSLGHALPMNPLAFSRAQQDSVALHERFKGDPQVFHVVACSYDTDFEPLGTQIEKKCAEIESVFSHPETIEVVLHLVDDTLDAGIMNAEFKTRFVKVRRYPLQTRCPSDRWGLKGLALREGFVHALAEKGDAFAYINLNLKAHAAQLATAFRVLFDERVCVALGSRAYVDGGEQAGAGALGKFKSRVYNKIAVAAFDELKAYKDTNGPMKVFNERAARALVRHARINDVGLDVEWLMIWLRAGCKVKRFGLYWQQRAGSHPPWSKTAMMLADLARLRRHFGP